MTSQTYSKTQLDSLLAGKADETAIPVVPTLAAVATTGAYSDLTGTPAIPTTAAAIGADPAGTAAAAIAALTAGASTALDTLAEIDTQIAADEGSAAALAALVATKADATAVAATYLKPRTPRVALLGDSITDENNYSGGRNTAAGYFSTANVILGHRLERIPPAAGTTIYNEDGSTVSDGNLPDKNFATPGYRTDQIIAAGYPAAAAASAADIVIVLAGTNDAQATDLPADIIGRLQTIWATLTAAGKTVVACTIPPMDASRSAATSIARDTNALIRTAASQTRGVVLCDWANAILDPSTDAIGANYTGDGVHPIAAGAFRLGTQLAAALGPLLPAPAITPWLPQDSGGSRSLTADPFGVSAVTTGWDFSGNTWCRFDQGSPTSVTVTKIPRTDAVPGNWTQAQVVAANPATDGTRLFIFANTGGKITDGTTKVRFVAEFQTDSAGLDCRGFSADCYMDPVGTDVTDLWYDQGQPRSAVGLLLPRSGVLLTPPVVVPAGTNHVQGWVDFYGSGTFRIGRMGIIAVD